MKIACIRLKGAEQASVEPQLITAKKQKLFSQPYRYFKLRHRQEQFLQRLWINKNYNRTKSNHEMKE